MSSLRPVLTVVFSMCFLNQTYDISSANVTLAAEKEKHIKPPRNLANCTLQCFCAAQLVYCSIAKVMGPFPMDELMMHV